MRHTSIHASRTGILLAALSCAACGGGGGSGGGDVAGIDAGGIQPVIASTVVTAFGSVVAGGVTYATGGAEILVDGAPGLEAELQTGQVVAIVGEVGENGDATAERIEFEHAIIGPIDSIDFASRNLVILGQAARTDAGTVFSADFSPGALEGLSEGDVVAVSGNRDTTGRLFLTRIDPRSTASYRLVGRVDSVAPGAMTLAIGELTVDYSGALIEGFAGGEPTQGDIVRVFGTRPDPSDPLDATLVGFVADGDLAEIETGDSARVIVDGFVTEFDSPGAFAIDGIAVVTDSQTLYRNGLESDISLNARLRVDATRTQSGTIVADSIEFRIAGTFWLEASVDAIDAAAGTLMAAGITIVLDDNTRIDDQSSAAVRPFGIDSFAVGDQIEVRGFETADGILATSIEREDDEGDADVELAGFVSGVNDPVFEIAGIEIVSNGSTEFDDIDRAEFFGQGEGWRVEVEAFFSGGMLVAEEIERDETNDGDVDED